jgi:hypothetical protein
MQHGVQKAVVGVAQAKATSPSISKIEQQNNFTTISFAKKSGKA